MNFPKNKGHLVEVENKKTLEILAYKSKIYHHTQISDEINMLEAKPYLEIYNKNKQLIINEFNRHKFSRRLILNFDNNILTSDDPNCMVLVQFIFRNSELHAIVYSRSSDIKKYDDDLATIKFILKDISLSINEKIGNIIFIAGSFHKYL